MLAVCITLWDGYELLDKCINNYRKFCGRIVLCWQDVSYTGNYDPNVQRYVELYKDQPDITIVKYVNAPVSIKENERRKHNLMIDTAREAGAEFFIMSAVDHFYDVNQVMRVMDKAKDYDVTYSTIHTYHKYPTWQITPQVEWRMPFICKLHPDTRVIKAWKHPVLVDEAVRINTCTNYHIFEPDELVLHNYSTVRSDIRVKYANCDLPMSWSKKKVELMIDDYENYDIEQNKGLVKYGGKKIKLVDNYFGL